MRLSFMRLWLLLYVTIWTSIDTVYSQGQKSGDFDPTQNLDSTSTIDQSGSSSRSSPGSGSYWQSQGVSNGIQGASVVEEALSILRSLESHHGHLIRFERGTGLFGTTFYYARKLFIRLFLSGPKEEDYISSRSEAATLSTPLTKAVKLLEDASTQKNQDALFLLAEMNFYGNFTHTRNYKEALRRYTELVTLSGNITALHMVGFMHATGIGGAVKANQAQALLYHTFSALGGNTKSEMTVAFRHHAGIGTPRNCNEAVKYYKKVADKAIAYSRSGPPGGMNLPKKSHRIADEEGGVYGEGASVVSSGVYANRAGPNSDQHAAFDDVLEYLDLMSRKGDLKATFSLGRLHYEGSRTMRRNLRTARAYFMIVVRKYWAKDGTIQSDDGNTGKIASKAAGYLGRMFLRGEGTDQSFEKAATWFKRGISTGDSLCQHELGLMHLKGYGLRRDPVLAANYLKAAAEQDFPDAQVLLGQLFLDQGDLETAMRYFDLAIRHGHIEAFYHLAEVSNNGVGRERSCGLATAYYKVVAEKAEVIHSSFEEANRAYDEGDKETALIIYMMAAEQGYESGQANVAYILDEHKSIFSMESFRLWKSQVPNLFQHAFLALVYWTRSAKQANIDSIVKMGDYYLGGHGVDRDLEKAATCYQSAAEMQQSAQALWNLGWMHENGIGVEQDFHLAKRFYDQALETNQESYLPVKLGLFKLRVRSFWNTITNGKVNSIHAEPEPRKEWSLSEWISNFLEEEHPYYHSADSDEDNNVDSAGIQDPMPGGDGLYDEIDEGILESLLIIGLAAALVFLVYYRQQRAMHHRRMREQRRQEEQQQQVPTHELQGQAIVGQAPPLQQGLQPEDGFFPPPGDPNDHGQWMAGGIGH